MIVQGGFGGSLSKIDIKIRIAHEGEVNRARIMPQNNVSACAVLDSFHSSLFCVMV